jgi:hypothetical protein
LASAAFALGIARPEYYLVYSSRQHARKRKR